MVPYMQDNHVLLGALRTCNQKVFNKACEGPTRPTFSNSVGTLPCLFRLPRPEMRHWHL